MRYNQRIEVTSYAAMDEAFARIARLLSDMGLRPGGRVTVQVRKSPAVAALAVCETHSQQNFLQTTGFMKAMAYQRIWSSR